MGACKWLNFTSAYKILHAVFTCNRGCTHNVSAWLSGFIIIQWELVRNRKIPWGFRVHNYHRQRHRMVWRYKYSWLCDRRGQCDKCRLLKTQQYYLIRYGTAYIIGRWRKSVPLCPDNDNHAFNLCAIGTWQYLIPIAVTKSTITAIKLLILRSFQKKELNT